MGTAGQAAATWRRDFALALLAALVALACSAASGLQSLQAPGSDNDSLLRLVEVRDLIAGQGWFDLHQYRMGPDGGFLMHWSRLVDAPIAGIVLLVEALGGGAAAAETAARIAWPALLFCLAAFVIVCAARRYGGEAAALPATVLGAAALYFMGVFRPGALDHHNVQITLTMAGLWLLLAAPTQRGAAFAAGAAIALSLAVGMETAPYVAAIGLGVSGLFALGGDGERPVARDFGLGFAAVSAAVFLATVPPSGWGVAACDAFSVVQFALAALGGLGLAAIASLEAANRSRTRRIIALALLAAVTALVTVRFFPHCLAAPYADVDPRLKSMWLDQVEEAQSLLQLLRNSPGSVVARYVTPLIALGLLGLRLRRGGWRREDWLVFVALFTAFLVSAWQVRGTTFAIAFAVIPLAAWVGTWRERAVSGGTAGAQWRMALVWIVSANASWVGVASAASMANNMASGAGLGAAIEADGEDGCATAADFATLASLPKTTVLAVSNLGSSILAYTGHRALAGPYHRNVAGNLAVLDAFTGPIDAAEKVARDRHIGLVAVCHADAEQSMLSETAPAGLLAALLRGEAPGWLEPVEASGPSLRLYRVR
jgi:hypothetical protein